MNAQQIRHQNQTEKLERFLNRTFDVAKVSCVLVLAEKMAKVSGDYFLSPWLSRFGAAGMFGAAAAQGMALLEMKVNGTNRVEAIVNMAASKVAAMSIPVLISLVANLADTDMTAASLSAFSAFAWGTGQVMIESYLL